MNNDRLISKMPCFKKYSNTNGKRDQNNPTANDANH